MNGNFLMPSLTQQLGFVLWTFEVSAEVVTLKSSISCSNSNLQQSTHQQQAK